MERVGISGLGLIGGSLALALLEQGCTVAGWDTDPETRELATAAGIEIVSGIEQLAETEMALVCAPPSIAAAQVVRLLSVGTPVVSDVCSLKASLVAQAGSLLEDESLLARYLPVHPMAGSAARGFAAAEPNLFAGAVWAACLTPWNDRSLTALCLLSDLIELVGIDGRMYLLSAEEHDEAVARTSHLPQLASTALGMLIAPATNVLSGPGLRDMTRLAASPGPLWAEILEANREQVLKQLSAYKATLEQLSLSLSTGDSAQLEAGFALANAAKTALTASRWQECAWTPTELLEPRLFALARICAQGSSLRRLKLGEAGLLRFEVS